MCACVCVLSIHLILLFVAFVLVFVKDWKRSALNATGVPRSCSIYEPEGTEIIKFSSPIGWQHARTKQETGFCGYGSLWFVNRTRPNSQAHRDRWREAAFDWLLEQPGSLNAIFPLAGQFGEPMARQISTIRVVQVCQIERGFCFISFCCWSCADTFLGAGDVSFCVPLDAFCTES